MSRLASAAALLAALALSPAHSAAADAEDAHAEASHDGHGQRDLNWFDFTDPETPPLIASFFNFALLAVLVYLILRKPIGEKVRTRRDTLEAAVSEAREMRDRAEAALAEAREKTEALDLEMARLRKEILDRGKAESDRIDAEAEKRSDRIARDAEALVEQEIARMSQRIREEVVDGVIGRAEEILRETVRAEDQARLSSEYAESMDAGRAPRGES